MSLLVNPIQQQGRKNRRRGTRGGRLVFRIMTMTMYHVRPRGRNSSRPHHPTSIPLHRRVGPTIILAGRPRRRVEVFHFRKWLLPKWMAP
jgi:hypothetical protein